MGRRISRPFSVFSFAGSWWLVTKVVLTWRLEAWSALWARVGIDCNGRLKVERSGCRKCLVPRLKRKITKKPIEL
jgi:hypothetical protein